MKFEKETGIYKGRFPVNELGGSAYTFEQVTGLYIKGERELFASQWTQEEIRIAEVRVLTIEEKPEERTSQEKHLQEEGIAREQMQGEPVPRDRFSGKASTATRSAGRISTGATDNRNTTGDITDRVIAETTKTGKTKERTAGKPDTAGDRGRTAV